MRGRSLCLTKCNLIGMGSGLMVPGDMLSSHLAAIRSFRYGGAELKNGGLPVMFTLMVIWTGESLRSGRMGRGSWQSISHVEPMPFFTIAQNTSRPKLHY